MTNLSSKISDKNCQLNDNLYPISLITKIFGWPDVCVKFLYLIAPCVKNALISSTLMGLTNHRRGAAGDRRGAAGSTGELQGSCRGQQGTTGEPPAGDDRRNK